MSTPARLGKVEDKSMETWIISHANIFLPICFILLFILIACLFMAMTGVSAVESGNYYNHLQDVI